MIEKDDKKETFIGDWGLGIGDWGLGIGPNPQSPIPNPQSPCFVLFGIQKISLRKLIFKNNKMLGRENLSSTTYCSRCKIKEADFVCELCAPYKNFCSNCDGYVHSMNTKRN